MSNKTAISKEFLEAVEDRVDIGCSLLKDNPLLLQRIVIATIETLATHSLKGGTSLTDFNNADFTSPQICEEFLHSNPETTPRKLDTFRDLHHIQGIPAKYALQATLEIESLRAEYLMKYGKQ